MPRLFVDPKQMFEANLFEIGTVVQTLRNNHGHTDVF